MLTVKGFILLLIFPCPNPNTLFLSAPVLLGLEEATRSELLGTNGLYVCSTASELRSCVKVEGAVLGSPSQKYCLYGLCGHKATLNLLRSCVKVQVAVLGSPSLIVCTYSVDVKQHWTQILQLHQRQWPALLFGAFSLGELLDDGQQPLGLRRSLLLFFTHLGVHRHLHFVRRQGWVFEHLSETISWNWNEQMEK